MIAFYIIAGTILMLVFIYESITLSVYGRHIVRGKRLELLKEEIGSHRGLNWYDENILSLNRKTEMKAQYISSPSSIFFSYNVVCNDFRAGYVVLRFSRAHFLIKDKFKSLKGVGVIKP